MRCEVCKKGTASLYRFMADFGKQIPVCAVCFHKSAAVRKGGFASAQSVALIEELAKALINFQPAQEHYFEGDVPKSRRAVCSNCGFEFEEYFKKGRLGCVQCYDVFHEQIRSIVYKIHGCVRHNGSRPAADTASSGHGSRSG